MQKEEVLSTLSALGFIPEELEGFGYRFEYDGLTLLYSVDEDDTNCLTFIVPGIFDISEENRVSVLEVLVKLSGKMKYVQPYIMFDNQVWLNYQHYLGDNEVTPELLEHMIRVLGFATYNFHELIKNNGNED